METIRITEDKAYREELTNHINETQLNTVFEHRYGRGWQRKLGAVLDVPETTVNGWFKSGRFPPLAKVAFGILLSRPIRPPGNWTPVKNGTRYAVCDTEGPIGRIVADNISSAEDATLLAASPQLLKVGCDVFDVLNDARDYMDGWSELAEKLEAALDAAIYGRSGNAEDSSMPTCFVCGSPAETELTEDGAWTHVYCENNACGPYILIMADWPRIERWINENSGNPRYRQRLLQLWICFGQENNIVPTLDWEWLQGRVRSHVSRGKEEADRQMSTDNDIRCHIVRLGGMPDPQQTVGIHHEAQAAAKAYQDWQAKPKDGTRYVMKVRNKHGEWPDEPLRLNEDDDTETIVRLIEEAAQSPY